MTPALLALALLSPAFAAESTATLKGLDIYRSEQIDLAKLEAKAGGIIRGYARMRADGRPAIKKSADNAKARAENELRSAGSFAYLDLYYSPYISSAERSAYITLDVVDEKDRKTRMPFRAAPTGALVDPEGLIAAWSEYSALGDRLVREGRLDLSERPACPGFYCSWGSATPELAALEKKFPKGAFDDKKLLMGVLSKDADPKKRAGALFVLSYSPDGKEVADAALSALEDPAVEVRFAGLQILSDLALYHKGVFIDPARLLPALDYPSTPERSRALGVLVGLAENPVYRPYLIDHAGPRLLELLRLQQPSNADLAFTVLSLLSKETYGRRDYDAWSKWLFQQRSTTPVAAPVPPQGEPPRK